MFKAIGFALAAMQLLSPAAMASKRSTLSTPTHAIHAHFPCIPGPPEGDAAFAGTQIECTKAAVFSVSQTPNPGFNTIAELWTHSKSTSGKPEGWTVQKQEQRTVGGTAVVVQELINPGKTAKLTSQTMIDQGVLVYLTVYEALEWPVAETEKRNFFESVVIELAPPHSVGLGKKVLSARFPCKPERSEPAPLLTTLHCSALAGRVLYMLTADTPSEQAQAMAAKAGQRLVSKIITNIIEYEKRNGGVSSSRRLSLKGRMAVEIDKPDGTFMRLVFAEEGIARLKYKAKMGKADIRERDRFFDSLTIE